MAWMTLFLRLFGLCVPACVRACVCLFVWMMVMRVICLNSSIMEAIHSIFHRCSWDAGFAGCFCCFCHVCVDVRRLRHCLSYWLIQFLCVREFPFVTLARTNACVCYSTSNAPQITQHRYLYCTLCCVCVCVLCTIQMQTKYPLDFGRLTPFKMPFFFYYSCV